MKEIIEPYLELAGVDAAALASLEGFLIASAGNISHQGFEALVAHAASMISIMHELALEMGQPSQKIVTLDLGHRSIILAPLNSEIFLMLEGDSSIIRLVQKDDILAIS